MIIRKLFKFEGAHIVRDCTSKRCSKSIHGHSYEVEVFLTANKLDRGQMVVDFGLLKPTIGKFIDAFDHTYVLWDMETEEFKSTIKSLSDRWIELPCSPSAESLSLMFLYAFHNIINKTQFNNNENGVSIKSVRVHETATGYAEASIHDLSMIKYKLGDIKFSESIHKEIEYLLGVLLDNERKFINEYPTYQIFTPLNNVEDIKKFVDQPILTEYVEFNEDDINKLKEIYWNNDTKMARILLVSQFKSYRDLIMCIEDKAIPNTDNLGTKILEIINEE